MIFDCCIYNHDYKICQTNFWHKYCFKSFSKNENLDIFKISILMILRKMFARDDYREVGADVIKDILKFGYLSDTLIMNRGSHNGFSDNAYPLKRAKYNT